MAKKENSNLFETLYHIEFNSLVKKKGGLDYLSWASAWRLLKSICPEATFEKHKNPEGVPYFPLSSGKGGFVTVSVTVGNLSKLTVTESLAVMDHRNQTIAEPNATQIQTANQRCLAKAIAIHGVALTLWTGEDLPEVWEEDFEARLPEGWTLAKVEALCHEKGWPQPAHVTPNRRDTLIEIISKL